MTASMLKAGRCLGGFIAALCLIAVTAAPVLAKDYTNALKGVERFDVVFDVSQGSPKVANIVFWAVTDAYRSDDVKALRGEPQIAVVFHGPAVKLLSNDKGLFNEAERIEVDKFQQTLKQMKKEGVKLEICLYAAKVLGVDKDTIIPEIDRVGNGFVSVVGYQMQGYGVVRIP